jgi:hypothetical protein
MLQHIRRTESDRQLGLVFATAMHLKLEENEYVSKLVHCATSRKVAGSIPDGVTGNFH